MQCNTPGKRRGSPLFHAATTLDKKIPYPRSRGCGPRQRILRGRPLIPGLGNTHSLTDDAMIVLDAMDLEARRSVSGPVHAPHRRQAGQHHGRRGRGRRAFGAGDVPGMRAARAADLPWADRLAHPPDAGEPRPRRHPLRCLQPPRADGGGMLAPTTARFPGDRLVLLHLTPLGSRTHFRLDRGGPDRPPVHLFGGPQSLGGHGQTRAARARGGRRLWWPPATRPLLGTARGCHPLVPCMIAPEARLAAPPSLPPAFRVRAGRLGGSRTGTPAGGHALAGPGDARGLFGVGGGGGGGRLLGPRAGVAPEKTARCPRPAPVSLCHCHWADHPVPVPTSGGRLPCPAGLCEPARSRARLLPPRLQGLPPRTRARHQRAQPHALLQAPPSVR
jgi:hypothetical protein